MAPAFVYEYAYISPPFFRDETCMYCYGIRMTCIMRDVILEFLRFGIALLLWMEDYCLTFKMWWRKPTVLLSSAEGNGWIFGWEDSESKLFKLSHV